MSLLRHMIAPTLLLLVVTACGSVPVPEVRHYDLAATDVPEEAARLPVSLRVEPFVARSGYYDQREFTYRAGERQLAFHDYHRWMRRPSEVVTGALLDGLRDTGSFVRVLGAAEGGIAELSLSGTVQQFEQVFSDSAAQGASVAKVEISARVTSSEFDGTERSVTVSGNGEATVSGADETGDRSGVAGAMDAALAEATRELCGLVVEAAGTLVERDDAPPSPQRVELDVRYDSAPGVTLLTRQVVVRVNRLDRAGHLDRLEVLRRAGGSRVSSTQGMRWLRFPSEMMLDGIIDCMRRAAGGGGRVLRPERSEPVDVEVDGYLRRFEIDESQQPAVAVVELEVTVGQVNRVMLGQADLADDSPDAVVDAFESAMREVVTRVPGLVENAGSVLGVEGGGVAAPEVVPRYLIVRWNSTVKPASTCDGSARVLRLDVRSGLNRLDVLRQIDDHLIEVDSTYRWQRYPGQVVTEALADVLRSSGVFRRGVGGPTSSGLFDLEIRGVIEDFQFRIQEGKLRAEVSLELEVLRRALLTGARTGPEVRMVEATGTAEVRGEGEVAVAAAMSRALTVALAAAVPEVGAEAADLLRGD